LHTIFFSFNKTFLIFPFATSPLRRFAFVEFGGEANVAAALLLNGATMRDRALKVNRSKNAITKPTVRFPVRRST
jgi:hypothetical protein